MKWICVFLFLTFSFDQNPVDKNYLLGKFDPAADPRFVRLTAEFASGSALHRHLRKETFESFQKMQRAAKKDGVRLIIISATRNFDSQKQIWENKWNGKVKVEGKDLTTITDKNERAKMILLYSSMPSTSRHHWGTDMDLNSLSNSYFEKGDGKKVYEWLTVHAPEYGFCQPYTSKINGRTGYEEEKWHWSYVPLSNGFLEEYKRQVHYSDIAGFAGSEIAESLQVIDKYVEGVSCR
ncbi:MAG TPA: M15 family metallopeptidase [Cyclobacteriaceae bacterium]|jgi:LAS superfamily LD-carboxypeptidase LdcB|nr:M15 family metallopeptidase [Cyclobacteriaceae bacterium]